MKLIESSIKRPVSVVVGVLFVALFGLISLFRIPIQLTPDVDRPVVTVSTLWPGASPEEVEQEIVQRQEEQLKTIEDLQRMTSESSDSRGNIQLEFSVGADPDLLLLKVSNKLSQVTGYPLDAERPVLASGSGASNTAITWLILDALPGHEGQLDVERYRDFAEEVVETAIERVPGVAQGNVFGGFERELQVIVDPQAMAARRISVAELSGAISRENANISAGSFDEGKRRYVVRTLGQYQSPEDLEEVVVSARDGAIVRVRDIARVLLTYKRPVSTVRQKGYPVIAINATRETGANVLEAMVGIRRTVAALNAGPLARENLQLRQVYDETEYITAAIHLVNKDIVIGSLLAVGVLFLYLRSLSSILIIAVAIPISIVGTFLAMSLLGRNINVISLAGLSFAVGMLVDNSIVALENIFRHRQMGKSRFQAAYDGVSEVWGALLASTLTHISVFLPVVFVQDEAGQLFRDIAIAVSCSVALSLIVAISVVPSMANKIIGGVREDTDVHPSDANRLDHLGHWVRDFVTQSVYRISGSTALRLLVAVALIGGSMGVAWTLLPKAEYLPTGNRNLVFSILLPPPGYNLDELIEVGQQLEDALRPRWEAQPGTPEALALGGALVNNMFYVAFGRQAFMGASARDPEQASALIPVIQGPLFGVPGMIGIVRQSGLFQGVGGGRAIDIEITGPDLNRLIGLGGRIFGQVMQVVPGAQARPIPSLDLGNPEVRVIPDRVRAAQLGLSARDLGFSVNALMDGALVDGYQYQGEEIDLTLRGADDHFHTQDIGELPIFTPAGQLVPLSSVARVQVTTGPEQINHIERNRAITIQVYPPETVALETAMDDIRIKVVQPLIDQGEVAPPYGIELSGTADDLKRTRQSMQWNFLLAIVITYLLMCSLFESFLYPFVIMLSVPPALAGGILGLAAVNAFIAYQPFDVLTMLGFVILIGVVLSNAILIVHQTLNLLREDPTMDRRQAISQATASRVRPIFMTVTTTTFGILPLVLFPGAGSELYRGLGSVVVGGLLVSTLFTLFLVPTFLSLAMDWAAHLRQRMGNSV
ncbi:MAG: efflux RND transporter permease subunit [Candidatus Latescibacteria bacterium]|nr:efflux RND transporter permease subunit [Candidatus Latescibacterota bacterium]